MNVLTFPSAVEASQQLARRIKEEVDKSETYHIALSGGVSAVSLYQALSSESIDWKKVHFYFAYEFVDGPKKGYNATLAKVHLFDRIPLPPSQIHIIEPTGISPEDVAAAYTETLKTFVSFVDGFPRFNMVLLDLYEDGHTLGLYPGDIHLYDHPSAYHANGVKNAPESHLVTLGFEALGTAKSLVFYSFGQHMKYVVGNMINLMPEAKEYPANYVTALYPWTFLYCDEEAMREKSYAIY